MKLGPRIIASQAIHDVSDIDDTWKIAAIETRFGTWDWPCSYEVGQSINKRLFNEPGKPRIYSGIQGRQKWDGRECWVLYVRLLPNGAKP